MNSSFRPNCPKCGEEMYCNMLLRTTQKEWHCHRVVADEYDCQYEECYEVSFYCYNKECQPEEDEI